MITQAIYSTIVPQQVICQLIGGGVPERYPDLHFALIEFNAHWLASLVGAMDKCWVTGIGQDADWWLGIWDETLPPDRPAQHGPAVPPEREVAVPAHAERVRAAPVPRVVPGRPGGGGLPAHHRLSTIVWGNDYPHAEGTFRGSRELIAEQFAGVPDDERDAMVGGTLGGLLGFSSRRRLSEAGT